MAEAAATMEGTAPARLHVRVPATLLPARAELRAGAAQQTFLSMVDPIIEAPAP